METGNYFQMALLVLLDQCIKGNYRKNNQESYFNDIIEILLKSFFKILQAYKFLFVNIGSLY
jgi:hypothetical protein